MNLDLYLKCFNFFVAMASLQVGICDEFKPGFIRVISTFFFFNFTFSCVLTFLLENIDFKTMVKLNKKKTL